MRHTIYIILFALTLTSCFNKKQKPKNNVYRPEFDISTDDKNMVYSYYQNGKASIYQIDITNNQKTKMSPHTEYSLIKPLYSPDNKKIACLAESLKSDIKLKICLIDINSKALTDLTSDSLLVLEFIFDPSGQSIYYTAASSFGNYSPVARKSPHNVDIYNFNIETRQTTKITYFDSYSLNGLSINNVGDSLFFKLITEGENGLYSMNIKTKELSRITASNDLRVARKLTAYEYYSPILSRDNSKIAFTEPYELYIMDRQTRISKLIFRNKSPLLNVGDVKFFYSKNDLIISLPTDSRGTTSTGKNFGFYLLDPKTSELKTLGL